MAAGARVYCTRERVTINARQEKSRVKSHRAYHLSPASLSGNKKENSDRLLWKGNFLPVQWESELLETRMCYRLCLDSSIGAENMLLLRTTSHD